MTYHCLEGKKDANLRKTAKCFGRLSVKLIASCYFRCSIRGINLQLFFNSSLVIINQGCIWIVLEWLKWTYVSKRDNNGNGDGTEKQDHTQREQDTLIGCDINLHQEKGKPHDGFNLTTSFLFCCLKNVVWGHNLCSSSHPALEAEDGDRKTNQRRDSQTQHHWFGVVKAGRRLKIN